ncbi:MAG TPA: oligopeptide ABC transporter permease [Symbiobacteriaceae bacterium]|nr:oligopeptide ABC transporter permease [Symbiobacteriaceae bacterium]
MVTRPIRPKRTPLARPDQKGGQSMWQVAWNRFRRDPKAMLGLYVILFFAITAILAPWISPHDPYAVNLAISEQAPSAAHLLGTDDLGRDVLSRLIWGGRISLTVGVVAVGISLTIGVVAGSIAGYYGGLIDNIIMRITDVVMVIPFFPLALTLAAVLKPSVYNTMIVIGLLGWTGTCRLVRGEFLTLRGRDFVEAATSSGASDTRIIFRHILPNAMAPILVVATLGVAGAVISEAGLSFLGFGVQQPIASWGNMLSAAISARVLALEPWLWIPAGTVIFISVLAVNLLGDGLRDALDPRMKQ